MNYSDKPRRNLNEALRNGVMSDEARAFVNGTAPRPATAAVPASAVAAVPTVSSPSMQSAPLPNANGVLPESIPDVPVGVSGTVSMTFRLPADLSAQLIRASVERKLRRERPFSQQDIVTEALADWLLRHR